MTPKKHTLHLVIFLFGLVVCGACDPQERQAAGASAKRYHLRGKVISVDKENKRAKIEHEEIPGYMPAMMMDFPISEDWVLRELTPGSEVRAELVVDNAADESYWLEKVGIIAAPDSSRPAPPVNEGFVQIGKEVPDFRLTNQDGRRISINDYRGKALALTFIYSECPLVDYCIRMSTNFSDLANRLADDPDAKSKIRLLTVSFDPERDTSEKLRSYGQGYLGHAGKPDFTIWQLAVGSDKEVRAIADFFGVRYEVDPNDKTQFLHSLRTAVIAPDGKVTKIFAGNEWTANDLIRELNATLR